MFMIADANINMRHDYHAAIAQFYSFIQRYPDQKKTPVALFQIGFLYNNELKMFDSAKAAYQDFIAKYPTHELKSSAEFELATMGKNPDEIIKEEPLAKKQVTRKGTK
jgi:TolA-binding protein